MSSDITEVQKNNSGPGWVTVSREMAGMEGSRRLLFCILEPVTSLRPQIWMSERAQSYSVHRQAPGKRKEGPGKASQLTLQMQPKACALHEAS